jgi:hypothetical protein
MGRLFRVSPGRREPVKAPAGGSGVMSRRNAYEALCTETVDESVDNLIGNQPKPLIRMTRGMRSKGRACAACSAGVNPPKRRKVAAQDVMVSRLDTRPIPGLAVRP